MATLPQTEQENIRAAIQSVLLDVLRRRASGEALTDDQVVASYPDLAAYLPPELAKLQQICAAELSAEDQSDVLLATTEKRALRTPAMLQLQCPHCRQPFETNTDTPLTDIVCSTCGGRFSLDSNEQETRYAPSLKSLAHFDLVERLGIGGFGTVWKARDRKLDRTVAVKIPRHGVLNNVDLEKFLREARAAAQLQHPNIVRVHEVGREEESVFIVSDFVRGIPLNEWLSGQQPTMRQAAELCATITEALQHAHDRGVIHRDLKPGNILIDGECRPHLMDFGLARREAGEVTVTIDGQVLGTPAYMSPEQARGEAHTADARSDIYSLGVILFELLTGELPFRGSPRMLMHQVIYDEPPSPRKFNGNVPQDLETITLQCLQKQPEKRYPTARDVTEELRRYLAGEPVRARPIGRLERGWRWCVRNPQLATSILTTLAALCIGLIVSTLFGLEARRQSHAALNSKARAELALATEREARADAVQAREESIRERNAAMQSQYYALMMAIPKHIDESRFDMARKLLTEAPARYRGWEWGHFARVCNLDLRTIHERDEILAVAFSPDGSRFASAGTSGLCTLYEWPSSRELLTLDGRLGNVTSLAFSPDGTLLVAGHGSLAAKTGGAIVWNVNTGAKIHTMSHEGGVKSVAFSRSGDLIATGGYDAAARLWSASAGEQVRVFDNHGGVVKSMTFSPTEDLLATADKGGHHVVKIWNYRTGEKVAELPKVRWGIESLAFSPDGRILATGTKAGAIELWAANSWERLSTTRTWGSFVWALAFSPDGKRLACSLRHPDIGIYSIEDASAPKYSGKLIGHGLFTNAVSFSPDGRFLLTGASDATTKIWAAEGKNAAMLLNGIADGTWPYVTAMRFARKRNLIAVVTSEDRYIRLWDAETGAEKYKLGPYEAYVHALDITSDGTKVIVAADDIRLWDLSTGASQVLSPGRIASADSVAFIADGRSIAASAGDKAIIWDAASNEVLTTIPYGGPSLRRLHVSPDDRLLATYTRAIPGQLEIWDVVTVTRQVQRSWNQMINALASSPDSKRMAVAVGNSARVIDVETGEDLLEITGHNEMVTSIAWSPDGQRIATVTTSGAMSIWEADNGRELLTFGDGWTGHLYSAAFSGDGAHLAVGGRALSDSFGVVVLTAYPWKLSRGQDENSPLDKLLDSLKRQEFNRILKAKSEPDEAVVFSR